MASTAAINRGAVAVRHFSKADLTLRLMLVVAGAGSLLWFISVFPTFSDEVLLLSIATQIGNGQTFAEEDNLQIDALVFDVSKDYVLRPSSIPKVAIIRLRRAEDSLRHTGSAALGDLNLTVENALSVAPTDSFLWLTHHWLRTQITGISDFSDLRASYWFGPREGWIAMRRIQVALNGLPYLPPDVAEFAVGEFASIVASGFYGVGADILAGPGWPFRGQLLASLASLKSADRNAFAKVLLARDLDVVVPGVSRSPDRPWLK